MEVNAMPDDIRSVWQNQTKAPPTVSLELIRRKARRLEGTMHQQVVSTYVAALMVVVIALYIFWKLDEIFFRMGACALILWAVSVVYQARKVLPRQLALNATLNASLDFYRQELERQCSYWRAGRNTVWPVLLSAALFLTPFVRGAMGKPGMRGFDSRESMYLLLGLVPFLPVMMILAYSVFVAVGRKLRAVQKEIEELDKFTGAARP
jgi:hypothetical protein